LTGNKPTTARHPRASRDSKTTNVSPSTANASAARVSLAACQCKLRFVIDLVLGALLAATLPKTGEISIPPRELPAMTHTKDGLEYAYIPAGSFEMGCVPADSTCESNEKPRHHVEQTKGFWIGRTLVTVSAYQRYVRAVGHAMPAIPSWQGADHPMVNVTWNEAQAFCQWSGGRLPSEAEWEYAARGGKSGLVYPLGNDMTHNDGNYDAAGGKYAWAYTSPVTAFAPNGMGLYDMAGNVWEWCTDRFDSNYYARSPVNDPSGSTTGNVRVVRGGSWNTYAWRLRTSFRYYAGASFRSVTYGFRCVRDGTRDKDRH
jgi:formylglycine-generating enzyme required for sulfatase activity